VNASDPQPPLAVAALSQSNVAADDPRSTADDALDEALEASFPASDPAANTVETGIRLGPVSAIEVTDNTALNRFELVIGTETAFLAYERARGSLVLVHTEVPASWRGLGFGQALVKGAIEIGRKGGLRIVAVCPFVRAYLQRHPAGRD